MIENSMFEEEPDVVDLAKEPCLHPLEPDEVEYEPRSSRLLVRGLGEHEMDDDEEDYESSAKLLGMSFINRSSGLRNNMAGYRQSPDGSCSVPSTRTMVVCSIVLVIAISVIMVIYLLPKCTFTKEGCHKKNHTMELIYPLATNGKLFPWAKMRLPSDVVPLHYDLELQPNLTTLKFSGSVKIVVNVLQVTRKIVLHSSGLNITKASLTSKGGSQAKPVELLEYPLHDQIAIMAPEALLVGQNYTVNIEYSSNLSDTYYGFYKISYKDENFKQRWFAATQFEPLAARSAFPCFDEPALKATFLIKIKRDEKLTALSNMPKKATTPVTNGIVQDEFFVSLKMSTYLVAFVVADLKNISRETNGSLVSVYAIPQHINQVEYALNTTVKLLEFYQKYFLINYPLEKLDLVAIPDFQSGAMENWGLVTFRETALLYDSKTSSARDKKLITAVIAHELAHQWFGNLVTMEWWNDLWLNEGFATFMEYFAMEEIFPELHSDEDFLNLIFKAMMKDSMNSSHPVSSAVQSSEQIEEMFDALSYIKGASLLLMLKHYLTKDVFQAGIEVYLHNHNYRSAQSDDLWDSMNEITNRTLDVKKLMKTWILNKGFPLVTVVRTGKNISIQQEKFLYRVEPENWTSDASYLWHIPLTYMTNRCNFTHCVNAYLLDQKSAVIELPEEVEWIKFNVDMNGYYIVHYAEDWNTLIDLLKKNHTALSAKDRANLINNIFNLASLGKESLEKAFELIDYLKEESSTAPLTQALFQLSLIYNLLEKKGEQQLAARVIYRIENLLGNKIDQQHWTDNGTLSERELRSMLLAFACTHDIRQCRAAATDKFEKWMKSNGTMSLPSDLMKVIFITGAKTNEGWEFLLKMYSSSVSEAEKSKMIEALASTEDVRKLIWLMQNSLEGEVIRAQELSHIVATVSQSLPGYLLAWDFVKENWEKLTRKFHLGSYTIQNIISSSTSQFATRAHLLEVKTFFESKSEESSKLRCVKEALGTIQLNIQWMERNLAKLQKWL
ncbi:leucyl-cystinyl aminopeptidase isoform X2 [Oxyura jamaicensis]|nr:leucyl-cystinyl aminopeptidase isoform X2 [Oxyura jamaicensis]XP_035165370.1 leucyl-cystinyl aminopeptidase isoform X2 [Oxyura jamaicensis]XP_035165371.1 leucyl-cystinyl aminopeptidase isoform X2 [Oxyura jamaicensis]XP_035165372.1 leucyl-cystinyl aminopeptidase isoform X2 [Oxyura jamaicensis]